jgi:hypothetical protein
LESTGYKTAILIPYFGRWPVWFEYFLQSCRYNTFIEWFFFTDCTIPKIEEDHIRFIPFTLDDFNALASERTGIPVHIRHPYKLCDLKPAYGDIFAEYINDYDFWGYGDIDLIYGDFGEFFTDEILENYDIISNHDEFISGHLSILRNRPHTISLYRKDDIYKKAFSDPYYTGFDEQLLKRKFNPDGVGLSSRMASHLRQHIIKVAINAILSPMIPTRIKSRRRRIREETVTDFTSIVRRYAAPEGIRVLYRRTFQSDLMLKKLSVKHWNIGWHKGRLTSSYQREEILYFHFIMSKLSASFYTDTFQPGKDQFTITRSGIKGGPE